jgi:hypothetical protein
MDDSGFSEGTRQTTRLSGSHVQQSKVIRTMTGACGPYNLGGSATPDEATLRVDTYRSMC